MEKELVPSLFSPVIKTENRSNEYRFQYPGEGQFICKATGLVFDTTREGEVVYWTCIWDKEWLQSTSRSPGGPLFEIQYPEGTIKRLHMPHCYVNAADHFTNIANITDEGSVLLDPLSVNDTHVIVEMTGSSRYGIVTRKEYYNPFSMPKSMALEQVRARGEPIELSPAQEAKPKKMKDNFPPEDEVKSAEWNLLMSVRIRWIKSVTEDTILRVTEALRRQEVYSDDEADSVGAQVERDDKARRCIDLARRKGRETSLKFMAALGEEDPDLHRELGLDKFEADSTSVS